jgi:hypothetical protein
VRQRRACGAWRTRSGSVLGVERIAPIRDHPVS